MKSDARDRSQTVDNRMKQNGVIREMNGEGYIYLKGSMTRYVASVQTWALYG